MRSCSARIADQPTSVPIARAADAAHLHVLPRRHLPHLLGNMLFLWVFGDNVEDAMGT